MKRRLRRNAYICVNVVANVVLAVPSRRLRCWFVRRVLRWEMGADVQIGRRVTIQNIRGITIGSRVVIHRRTWLDLRGGITIGDDVAISSDCRILTADHDPDSPTRAYRERAVSLGDRVWIATGACLLPGTLVEDGCIVGSAAVAHGKLEAFAIYAGNPARKVRDRSRDAQARLSGVVGLFE